MSPIQIRHIEDSDAQAVAEIYKTEAVIAQTTQIPHRTAGFWQHFYKNASSNNVELVALWEGQIAGHLGILLNNNLRRRHVGSFGIAVHPDYQGKGVGTALMKELIHLSDQWLNLLKIELSVYADNQVAIDLYERFGFVHEGKSLYDAYRQGRYATSLNMARYHPKIESRTASEDA